MDILSELNYKSQLYKLNLIRKERDIFNNPVSSNDLDKLAKAMEEDVHQEKEFVFVHPTSNSTEYSRRYIHCPINGNTLLFVGKMREPGDFAILRITLHSIMYHVPYLVIEDYSPAFRKPEILAKMVKRAFDWSLKNDGLEVILEPWETNGEPIYFAWDNWVSYVHDLRQHPEIGAMCMGFEEALHVFKEKKAVEKAKKEKKEKKKLVKSDDIMDYIKRGNPEMIIKKLHYVLKGLKQSKDVARPIRFLIDHGVIVDNKLPFKAFIKEFPEVIVYVSDSRYYEWTDRKKTSYNNDDQYQELEKIFEFLL